MPAAPWRWIVSLPQRRSPPSLLFFGLSLGIYVILLLSTPPETEVLFGWSAVTVHRCMILSLATISTVMLAARNEHTFHSAIGMHFVLSAVLLLLFQQPQGNAPILLVAGLLPLSVHEWYPLSLGLCGFYAVLTLSLCGLSGQYPALFLAQLLSMAAVVSLTGSLMGRYWETIITLQRYVNRLEGNVAALTRANSLSQNYARDVEEESRAAERLRLTRDIHDSIGYTMTNTIMAMEAVKMMVQSEPQRITEYLEVARTNTEEGLTNIKRILRDFRRQETTQKPCFQAIRKLVKVFTLSTGLDVRYEFGNADMQMLDRFGECVYHFIQEGLINAFRHGRATRVRLLFWDYGNELRISLDDDGCGCAGEPVLGIGITGMKERARLLGGRVSIDAVANGFRISMILPKDAQSGKTGRDDNQAADR